MNMIENVGLSKYDIQHLGWLVRFLWWIQPFLFRFMEFDRIFLLTKIFPSLSIEYHIIAIGTETDGWSFK